MTEAQQKYYQKNREKIKAKNKERIKIWNKRNNKRFRYDNLSPETRFKKLIHKKVKYAIQTGKLIKPKTCQICKEKKQIESHHENYNKPLEVLWLCRDCHKKLHRKYVYDNEIL